MLSRNSRQRTFQAAVFVVCCLGMLATSVRYPVLQVSAQGRGKPKRSRSNHDTEVEVPGPSKVRNDPICSL